MKHPRRTVANGPVRSRSRRFIRVVGLLLIVTSLSVAVGTPTSADAQTPRAANTERNLAAPLHYGYNFDHQAPDAWQPGSGSARRVMASLSTFDAQAIMGWGAMNPEPSPGVYDWQSLDARIALIRTTGGTPVITLCCAPDWMKGGPSGKTDWSRLTARPANSHFDDFATLSATVALRYPDVRYFVVWKELMGFYDKRTNRWQYEDYTRLYNAVYTAIKAARPDAVIGGGYVPMDSWSTPQTASNGSTPRGPWGTLDQRSLDALSYFLRNAVGCDFLSVDGGLAVKDRDQVITNPLTALAKFATINKWLRARTSLPIWWMESTLAGSRDRWSPSYNSALRLLELATMKVSGASVAMQWQPEEDGHLNDAGLWSSTEEGSGGTPTLLAGWLADTLPRISTATAVRCDAQDRCRVASPLGPVMVDLHRGRNAPARVHLP